jgi:GT2 family glycosyltransferase
MIFMIPNSGRNVAIVAIGRNEGARLKSCLESTVEVGRTVVYVDSGSRDGSVAYAKSMGCHVIQLDDSRPFSAARARNEGFACVLKHNPQVSFIQFVDGDCELVNGWLEVGVAALAKKEDVGVLCGHVREVNPTASVYNKLCNLEWQQTPGIILTSGGRFMIRPEVFTEVGGFREEVIAAEDDEFCVRVRRLGWKVMMVDAPMALHDAEMNHFSEWWRRAVRTGHAYGQVAALHGKTDDRYFVDDCRRIWIWGFFLPVTLLALAPFTLWVTAAILVGLYAVQFDKIYIRGRKRGWAKSDARTYAFFTVIAKFPMLQGLISYHWRHWRGHSHRIIEYKKPSRA